ncbi:WD40-repeat-containing domain protein [Cunninghamella echinulata]|nr:WD40-repeat-containing domain protein [Cunninghamella echinulata]
MSIEIESEDIIRLILQFFKENNLKETYKALEEETSIKLNTVENKEEFIKDIIDGKWDIVLQQVVSLNIPPKSLIDLYEQVILELTEMRELGAARSLLRQTEPMYLLKKQHPQRYLQLEHILSRTIFDPREAYPGNVTKEKRRQTIAQGLINDIAVAAPSRLLTLLDQSAQWQEQQGLTTLDNFDVFKGGVKDSLSNLVQSESMEEIKDQTEDNTKHEKHIFPSTIFKRIKFPGKSTYAECLTFSPDGQSLVTGSVDGFIEVWNSRNGKLRKDLNYQAEGNMMAMNESVICLAYSQNGELLVSGSTDGKISVWKIHSGVCKRRISPAHSQGVTTISINRNATQILSGSYDQLIKIHEIQSGKLLKEFKGHSAFVNNVVYINDDNHIISGSSDGVVKVINKYNNVGHFYINNYNIYIVKDNNNVNNLLIHYINIRYGI